MRDHFEQIRDRGAAVLTITFATPEMLRLFIDEGRYPFPVLADPDHAAYRAFGLERATWRRILSPRVLLGYLSLMFRGWAPRRGRPGEDYLQLGGDFVFDAAGRLVLAFRSAEPTDRPSLTTLLDALSRAAGA